MNQAIGQVDEVAMIAGDDLSQGGGALRKQAVRVVADTAVVPTPTVVARPFEPAALLTVAAAPSDEPQVT